jgi:zinc-binding alcohol dehydrogenase/oxidoreductase
MEGILKKVQQMGMLHHFKQTKMTENKALVLNRTVEDKIEIKQIPLPNLKPNEVRVSIKSVALNHRDEWCRQGLYPNISDGVTLGSDGAGIVDAVGAEVDKSWLGKEVIINPAMHWGENEEAQSAAFLILGMPQHGTFATYVQVQVDRLHEKPFHLNWHEAAALPLAGVTAFRALVVKGQAKSGQKVLVTGFGGGVAQFAVQFALALGLETYVSSSDQRKIQVAKDLGAQAGFDYTSAHWVEQSLELTGGFDLVIDSAMGNTLGNLVKVTKPGGSIVFFGATKGNPETVDVRKLFWSQIKLIGTTMGSDRDFAQMLAFVAKHQIAPLIDSVTPLDSASEAFDKMKAGSQLGKLVLQIG